MSRHVVRWVRVVVVGLIVLTAVGAVGLPAAAQGGSDPSGDFDGDGISNRVDPDDDNDGVTDENDCAPFDAGVTTCGEPEPPSLIDPELDSDGDGISNRADPDDDNDGVTDDRDCRPLDAAVSSCESAAPTPAPAAPARPAAPSGGSGGATGAAPGQSVSAPAASDRMDLVVALPVTGSGGASAGIGRFAGGVEAILMSVVIATVLALTLGLASVVAAQTSTRLRLRPAVVSTPVHARGSRHPRA